MCGIVGAVGRIPTSGSGPARIDERILQTVTRASEALRHRGPDGDGLFAAESAEVILAHRRLAILDLSEAGAQPMIDRTSGCVVTFNGEIYNFDELRSELKAAGETFHSSSDTEVLLKAYKVWGLSFLPRLRGIFAFAIWDPRSRCVHLVRDQLGIKPLYWMRVPGGKPGAGTLFFSSEVRALFESGACERRLNPTSVASYLWHGFVVGPQTMVDGVNLLPAGHVMTLSGDTQSGAPAPDAKIHRYWNLPSSNTDRKTSDEELREELRRTVALQLVSDAPLGIFLSGGIDSSAVAALASETAPESLHTFTIGFDDAGLDESRFATKVAAAIGSRHSTATLREADFLNALPQALSAIDQPTFDGLNTYFVSRAAREAGMTVALAGTGGDELFGGYPSFSQIPKMHRVGSRIPAVGLRAIDVGARMFADLNWSLLGRAPRQTRWGKLADVALAAHDVVGLYQVFYALFTRETQARLADPKVRDAQGNLHFGLTDDVAQSWRQLACGSEERHAVSLLELNSFVGERLLRDTDAASMAVSLEVRVPLLDHVLFEKVAALPAERRFSPPGRKQLLRDLALRKLDPAMFERPKSGFVLPIGGWAQKRLRGEIESMLSDPEVVRRAGLDPKAVRVLWQSFEFGRPGLYWSRIWSLYMLVKWCEVHGMSMASP